MEGFLQDLRYGSRMLLKHRGFTVIAILTLALGIGANSAIFSVVNAVLLRPLQFKEPDRIVKLWETLPQGGTGTVSVPNLEDWREQSDAFTGLAAYEFKDFTMQGQDNPERISGASVSANFFDVLEARPLLGRGFLPGEDRAGGDRIAVLSYQLWQSSFGADPQIIDKTVPLGGESLTVVGVMPPEFKFPSRLTALWVPLVFSPGQLASRGSHAFFAVGRLKPGVTLEQAREQMKTIGKRLEQQYPDQQAGRSVMVIPLQEEVVQNVRPALLILLGAVALVLLIACTNVANLLLARASGRRKEIAIRTALGARRGRLVRQFLTESVLLSLLGGALGLLLAYWGLNALLALAGGFLPRAGEVGLDQRMIGFTLVLSILTGVGFGLAPALMASRADVQGTLKESGNAGSSAQRSKLRGALVVTEVALALILLIGAGLLIKSFMRLQSIESGMRPGGVLTLRVSLPESKYATPQSAAAFYQQLTERLSNLPGVEAAGAINLLPLQQSGYNGDIEIEGREPFPKGQEPLVEFRASSPDYFRALGIPLLSGRFFSAQDQENSSPVVIINQTLARQLLANEDPIGKRIRALGPDWKTVV
ncbi:MAG TPA: ABC transporter permease, partial [Blastocatellia bacterium]|nr:ABC transporter permease [Blastocatellia bacterium]